MDIDDARAALAGVWSLVAYEDRASEADEWGQTYGKQPRGVILYHPSGLLAVHVYGGVDALDPVAYFGTYFVREARRDDAGFSGVVEHRMQSAIPPELLEEHPDRPFLLAGDQLTLGDRRTSRRLFERVT